ncbi:HlyD family type I secretion periplasmic adaptor subunit [Paramagnetospirillum kuznetsovii]|uniref:Membrane fusion protein (MFP) family protein n=1 Tax=Paramagnetospirillum kuznetsovii TaxID=2053833 RepID=A0A364NSN8_9PROT|nr:HlyD family type I secretion periplasmic adaptor subunit [Paramagnetospirillum kuznetsovii]RAU20103.1 HlyD family type I secretion periplasmic adaptor subunit [Paramagnetospirillum kuznetsovii]
MQPQTAHPKLTTPFSKFTQVFERFRSQAEDMAHRSHVRRGNRDFMSELNAAVTLAPRLSASILLFAVLGSVFALLLWAGLAHVERVASGQGRVIPSSQVQMVQSLEGGIVAEILTQEGQSVHKGQVLLVIDDTQALSKYKEDRAKYLSLLAASARLEAEVEGRNQANFPSELIVEAPQLVTSERELLRAHVDSVTSSVAILNSQIDQKQQEVRELEARISQLEQSRRLAAEEAHILEPLVEKGVSSRMELIQLKRQINDIEGTLAGSRQGIVRARSAVEEARQRLDERRTDLRSESQGQLSDVRNNLAALSEALKSTHDRLRRTEMRSPVEGTVKQVYVTTVGGVIKPGQDVIAIVPREDSLLVEAKIKPNDIAFIHPGQPAKVRVTAYDYAVYGALEAKLEHISADSIIDEKGESYFKVNLRTEGALTRAGEPLPIIPGMTAEVDVVVGKRTVLEYLLKPIFRAQEKAMRER